METFLINIYRNVLNHLCMLRFFSGLPIIDCYQNHGPFKSHTFFDNIVSFMQ